MTEGGERREGQTKNDLLNYDSSQAANASTVCRPARDYCDLPEMCPGGMFLFLYIIQ